MTEKLTIMVVDDHVMLRQAFVSYIEKHEDLEVVAEAEDGREAIDKADEYQPDIILMDILMPGLNGLEAIRRILAKNEKARIICCTGSTREDVICEALELGAMGYVEKNGPIASLIEAVRQVAAGNRYLGPAALECVMSGFLGRIPTDGPRYQSLTSREREVLQLMAEGHTNNTISQTLNVSTSTVETHRRRIKEKLGIDTTAGLISYAIREGLTGE